MANNNLSGTITLKIQVPGIGNIGNAGKNMAAANPFSGKAGTGLPKWQQVPQGPYMNYNPMKAAQQKFLVPPTPPIPSVPPINPQQKKQGDSTISWLKKIAGVAGIAGILAHSKILSQTTSAMTELLGALIDVILMPLIPGIAKVLQLVAKIIMQVMEFIQDPTGYLLKLWGKFVDWLKTQFNNFVESFPAFKKLIEDLKPVFDGLAKIVSWILEKTGLTKDKNISDLKNIIDKSIQYGIVSGITTFAITRDPKITAIATGIGGATGAGVAIHENLTKEGGKMQGANILDWMTFILSKGILTRNPFGEKNTTINITSTILGIGVLTPEEYAKRLQFAIAEEISRTP